MNRLIRSSSAIMALATGLIAFAQPCEWSALGGGIDGGWSGASVKCLEIFDDGSGDALYVGGSFQTVELLIVNHVAKWDGRSWSALGDGLRAGLVYDLAVFDDGRGGGPALYAGGSFEASGGKPVQCVARWDGDSWSQVGEGLWPSPSSKPTVHALHVHDDGAGPALYAGGWFSSVDGAPGTYCIARWDGGSWSSVGGGVGSRVWALTGSDDGSDPVLYAAGYLQSAGGTPVNYVARWNGASWSDVGGGMNDNVTRLATVDDGSGSALFAAGRFTTAGGVPVTHLARWDGRSWSQVGEDLLERGAGAFGVFDDGRGKALYAGGSSKMAGATPINGIARWDGTTWSALGSGVGGIVLPGVSALAVFEDGMGPALYAAGSFLTAGGVRVNHIARWRCDAPPPCYADCDGSGALDFLDFLCFQNLFAAADPLADCDGSGVLDFFDFLCFQNAFAAGCP